MANPGIVRNVQESVQQMAEQLPMLQPKVEIQLSVAKQEVTKNADGTQKVSWMEMGEKPVVTPGDVLRFNVNSENSGKSAAKNLVVTQPVPSKTTYQLQSALANGAQLTYSIDGGKTFVAQPTVTVKLENGQEVQRPAPAEAYTHVRWTYSEALAPAASFRTSFNVAVN
jgi:uncharacterized repeat protein (TIGR01451 family)